MKKGIPVIELREMEEEPPVYGNASFSLVDPPPGVVKNHIWILRAVEDTAITLNAEDFD